MFKTLKSEEGAGLTEFAIMTVMLVPIVTVAVYASESMSTALKVREAEVSSAWAATSYRLHSYVSRNGTDDRFASVGRLVAQRTKEDLVDLDSAQNLGARGGRQMVVTDAKLSRLNCGMINGPAVTPVEYGQSFLHSGGWLTCRAQASLDADHVPTYENVGGRKKFTDYGTLLKRLRNLNLQGMGRQGMVVVANDWGLENGAPTGGRNSKIDDGAIRGNPQYWTAGKGVFDESLRNGTGNIVQEAMRDLLGGNDMGNTDGFKLGYDATVAAQRSVPTPGPNVNAHLSPTWEYLKNEYYDRDNRYLGSDDPREFGN